MNDIIIDKPQLPVPVNYIPEKQDGHIPVAVESPAKTYHDLGDLERALRANPIFETAAFPMNRMKLREDGVLHTPHGDFRLSEGSLKDLVSQSKLGIRSAKSMMDAGLRHVVVYAINEFCRIQDKKKKRKVLYHPFGNSGIAVSFPSERYQTTPHLRVLETAMEQMPERLRFSSATLSSEQLKVAFLDPERSIFSRENLIENDRISGGISCIMGYRYRAIKSFLEFLRLICTNGATAWERSLESRTVHVLRKDGGADILADDFAGKIARLLPELERFSERFPRLIDTPVTSPVLYRMREKLAEVPRFTRQQAGELLAPFAKHARIEWEWEGDLPKYRRMGDVTSAENMYDLYNLVTQLGRDAETFNQRHELSLLGGQILGMN